MVAMRDDQTFSTGFTFGKARRPWRGRRRKMWYMVAVILLIVAVVVVVVGVLLSRPDPSPPSTTSAAEKTAPVQPFPATASPVLQSPSPVPTPQPQQQQQQPQTPGPTTSSPTLLPTPGPTPATPSPITSSPTTATPTPVTPVSTPLVSTPMPTSTPTPSPTPPPTPSPTSAPTPSPTSTPIMSTPTSSPTTSPPTSNNGSVVATTTSVPSASPSFRPSKLPSSQPSLPPSSYPTATPSVSPSQIPSMLPTIELSMGETAMPVTPRTTSPTQITSNEPSATPSIVPTVSPTASPSQSPSVTPTNSLTAPPSQSPTNSPSSTPSTLSPTIPETPAPITVAPTKTPSSSPSRTPTDAPVAPPITSTASPTPSPTTAPIDIVQIEQDARARVDTLIRSVAVFEESEFDGTSYQSMALAWLIQDYVSIAVRIAIANNTEPRLTRQAIGATSLLEDLSDQRLIQRYALACLYLATYSVPTAQSLRVYPIPQETPGWTVSTGWLSSEHECTWYGIICSEIDQVTRILLQENLLTGTVPRELTLLKDSLVHINLFRNLVHNAGDEGNAWLGELTGLQILLYGDTNFEYDGIPTEIGLLTNLVEYDCSFTLYFGPLRGEVFTNLLKLEHLSIGGNAYTNATIPTQITRLPNLNFLYADNAFLQGTLDFVLEMPNIYELWIDVNPGIRGTIPNNIGDVSTLQSISWTECSLTGTIPSSLGQLTRTLQIWLYRNQLTGTIPTELGNLERMSTFEVYDNLLTGFMPTEVCERRNIFSNTGLLQTLSSDCAVTDISAPVVACDCCTCCENCFDQ